MSSKRAGERERLRDCAQARVVCVRLKKRDQRKKKKLRKRIELLSDLLLIFVVVAVVADYKKKPTQHTHTHRRTHAHANLYAWIDADSADVAAEMTITQKAINCITSIVSHFFTLYYLFLLFFFFLLSSLYMYTTITIITKDEHYETWVTIKNDNKIVLQTKHIPTMCILLKNN